jgi:aminoglycoside phosphotransferase (APT) family kinase protein
VDLPPLPTLSGETVAAIAGRLGVPLRDWRPMPRMGIFNDISLLNDELVLRVPRIHPAFTSAIEKEAVVIPAARRAGVRTPAVVLFDQTEELLPVPYLVCERVPGRVLEGTEPEPAAAAWAEVGHDLGLLHSRVPADGPTAGFEVEPLPDARELPGYLARDGYLTTSESGWLERWLDRLAPAALTPVTASLRHGDLQGTNVLVGPDRLDYRALIDWGAAGWSDPAHDFAGIPLRAVPHMLAGYRRVATLPSEETAQARILWRHLQIALFLALRPPQPDHSWAERPLAMLLEIMRFLLTRPAGWRDYLPA